MLVMVSSLVCWCRFERRLSKQKSVNFPRKSESGEVGNERGDKRRRSFKFSKKFPFVKGNKEEGETMAEMGAGEAGPVYEAVQLHESESGRPLVKYVRTYVRTHTYM